MQQLRMLIEKVAKTDANLLITGENGTGKEMLAREIHLLSPRKDEAMVPVDMGAITETLFESELFGHVKGAFTDARTDRPGKFEVANNGSLFLDEIGNLSYHLQAKLLTALQRRSIVRVGSNTPIPINIRLICATNRDLQEMVQKEQFREDLLYRINTIHVEIPPLRERPEDIVPLTEIFITKYTNIYGKKPMALTDDAKEKLMERFGFTDIQAQAILDMRLARLSGLEREKVENEYRDIKALIAHLTEILGSEQMVLDILKEEIGAIRDKFGDARRTSIEPAADDIDIEDLIEEEENVITLTHQGYIKRLSVDTYRSQKRGGRGIIGLQTKEEDFVSSMFVSSTHAHILFFTNKGRMYRIKAYEIPEGGRTAKGTPIVNLLALEPEESISAVIPVREYEEGKYLVMCTRAGVIKKTDLMEYQNAPKAGKIAIRLDDEDELIRVVMTDGSKDLFIGSHGGKMIRFHESDVRNMGRVSRGVRGISLEDGDYVIGMSVDAEDGKLLVVSEKGYGKKTELSEYKCQSRGGKGTTSYRISEATGAVAGLQVVTPKDDVILITSEGVIIRMDTEDISTYGRVTKGVRLMRLADDVNIVTVACVEKEPENGDAPENEDGTAAAEISDAEETGNDPGETEE